MGRSMTQHTASRCVGHIAAKKIVSVVIAIAIWGQPLQSSTVQLFSDNMSVVCALSAGTMKNPLLMHLLRCLHFFTRSVLRRITSQRQTTLLQMHYLATGSICFYHVHPRQYRPQLPVPQPLLNMLLHNQPDWTSPN